MLADYHIHSRFSDDSKADLEAICHQAIDRGLKEIAITDHDDRTWPKRDPAYTIRNFDLYFRTLEDLQSRFQNQLTIRVGLEIGFNHCRMPDYLAITRNYPFDFIIGSAHEVRGAQVHAPGFFIGRSKDQAYSSYYDNLRDFVLRYGCFDVVGHLTLLRRHQPEKDSLNGPIFGLAALEKLLQALIDAQKGIEVNTSGYRLDPSEPLPGPTILALYRQLGGNILTIGSDAHRAQDVGFGIHATQDLLRRLSFSAYSRFERHHALQTPLS